MVWLLSEQKEVHSSVSSSTKQKGGFRASMFIYVFSTLDNIGFVANVASLVLYFHFVMQFDLTASANTLTNFMGSTFLLTVFGGFISDTYFNRLYTCLSFGILEVLVIVAATMVRSCGNLSIPVNPKELYETDDRDAIEHTSQFRFLNKAATVQEGETPEPWRVCTVTQVEEFKILIRMLPILLSTVIMNTCSAQLQTYSVLQGYSMNTRIGSLKFPSASIPVIPLVFMAILLPIYEFLFVPPARKFTGHPTGITQLQRVGIGLVLSFISMGIARLIEVKRRHQALKDPLKPISPFWLSFQYAIFGVGDIFALVGLAEFFYREAPKWMRSLATSLATDAKEFQAVNESAIYAVEN
ncbi:unnamed protein product [Coffea canephora]|uniref:Uncharacterized protein n=1 Tax=Coffea canephora TaxID=49390 RepID=A0A068UQ38_COFCA|nr:unnamed protein product [Coffea canephora]